MYGAEGIMKFLWILSHSVNTQLAAHMKVGRDGGLSAAAVLPVYPLSPSRLSISFDAWSSLTSLVAYSSFSL